MGIYTAPGLAASGLLESSTHALVVDIQGVVYAGTIAPPPNPPATIKLAEGLAEEDRHGQR